MRNNIDSKNWVDYELSGIDFGDKRLDKRTKHVLKAIADNPQASIPESSNNWSETIGTYRLINNKKVNCESMLKPHVISTLERMKHQKIVLAVQDTTSLNYTGLKVRTSGLGDVGDSTNGNAKGLIMHNTYAISTEGVPLGTLDSNIWSRKTSKYKKSQKRANTPIEKKESYKWPKAIEQVTQLTKDLKETKIIHIMDREGDIYEVFSEALNLEQSFIIRVKHNRRVNKSSRGADNGQLLTEVFAATKPLGIVDMIVNARDETGGNRSAKVEIKAVKVKIPAPRAKSNNIHRFTNKDLEQTVIWVREIDFDEDTKPIDWKLITNVDISSSDEVLICIDYYCKRWHIEVFFRILKTGCRVEECRFSTAEKIKVFVILLLIVAWHIHRLTLLTRILPKANPDIVFTKREQTILSKLVLRRKPPKKFRLSDFVTLLARLGGFLNRKCDGVPGPEVLWRGWIRLKEFINNLSIIEEVGETYD